MEPKNPNVLDHSHLPAKDKILLFFMDNPILSAIKKVLHEDANRPYGDSSQASLEENVYSV